MRLVAVSIIEKRNQTNYKMFAQVRPRPSYKNGQAVASSKAKLLWSPYTSTQDINFLFFPSSSTLFVYSYLTIYNVNIL